MNAKAEYKDAYRRVRIVNMNTPTWREIQVMNERLQSCNPVHVWILKHANQSFFDARYR